VGRSGQQPLWSGWLYDAPVVGPFLWRRLVRRGFTVHMPP
jgi:hypothetical protein